MSELSMETPDEDAAEQAREVPEDDDEELARCLSRQTRPTPRNRSGTRAMTTRTIVSNHRPNPENMVTATSTTRPRGTRLPRLARRRQLLDAAMEVFVARGYHAAAMDEIAERAGVSKPVLYQHFPGKQELYLALLDESVGRLVEAVAGAIRSTTDNRQRVNATFAAYFEYVAEHSGTFKLVFESDFTSEPAVRARLDAADRECADLISQVIREDAGLADDEAYLLSIGLLGMAQVSARYWLSTLGSIPRESGRAARRAARLARHQRLAAHADQGEAHQEGEIVEVKIGIQSIPRELIVDTDATAEEVERDLTAALAAQDGKGLFALTTQKGGRVLVPADKIAFIEFSTDQARRVGFGNIV